MENKKLEKEKRNRKEDVLAMAVNIWLLTN